MHVAFFIQDLAAGGAQRVTLTLAGAFAAEGDRVDLLVPQLKGEFSSQIPPGVRVVPLGCTRVLTAVTKLASYLRVHAPAALIAGMPNANVAAVLARGLARAGTRIVVTEHTQVSQAMIHNPYRMIRWSYRLAPWAYRAADHVVAVSEGVASDLCRSTGISESVVTVIYNPVTVAPDSGSTEVVERLLPRGVPTILAVGRLSAAKDFSTLLKAFGRLREERLARLVILGEGEERRALENIIVELGLTNDVSLPGYMPNVALWMRRANVYALSSRWEGLPTSLIEAMACGTPVVATNCESGPAEILENGRYGALVPVGDVQGLARALVHAIDHPADQAYLRKRAAIFSAARAVKAYKALLS